VELQGEHFSWEEEGRSQQDQVHYLAKCGKRVEEQEQV